MNADDKDLEAFGRRAGELLRQDAEQLDGATRSRLARARAEALEQKHGRRHAWLDLRALAPAGAVAGAALVAVLLVLNQSPQDGTNRAAASSLDDLELLADADAWEMSQETDLEFIEWAAGMAELEGTGG